MPYLWIFGMRRLDGHQPSLATLELVLQLSHILRVHRLTALGAVDLGQSTRIQVGAKGLHSLRKSVIMQQGNTWINK
jgi:hypothetical protein